MLTDRQIRNAQEQGELGIKPFATQSLQPASYDFRVGPEAFTSLSIEKLDIKATGLLAIEPGEFAVLTTLEEITCGRQYAALLGLRSEYARKGLQLLSGPQIDPGFSGTLVVRLINLSPHRLTLTYGAPFLSTQFFHLSEPVETPYAGSRQHQTGLNPSDIQELADTEGLSLGGVIKVLSVLQQDVAELRGSVARLAWVVPLIIGLGIAIAVMVGIK